MATTTDLTTLKINYLSQAQYDNALANNQINSDELYFTPADNGVTLNVNGQSTSSPSFYAPTGGGTADTQALVSGGTATAPKWVDISPSITVTAGTSNATPKVNVTVLGQSGTAQSITQATTGIYGATKLTNTYTSTDETLATTGKSILAAIQTLDVTAITGAANKTITSISETDGKISATYSDIGSLDAGAITTGKLALARGGTNASSYRINSVIVGSETPTVDGGTNAASLTWVASGSGALYSTGTNVRPQFGTLPVAQGGTGNTSYTANRMIYSESAAKLSASGHYASSDKIAINSTSIPNENLYVNGTSRFSLGSQPNDKTTDKKFIIGSSGMRYLSFGGAGIQAYDASNNASILYLNYYGGNLIVGQNGYDGCVTLNTTTAASNFTTPSLRVMQNAQITNADVNHMAQFLASNMETGGANAIVLGKAVSANQAGGLLYTHGTTPSLSFGFVNNLGLLKITSNGSIYINSGSSSTHNTNTSELLVKGRVVVDLSYHNQNNFSEFRINRSTAGWSAITLGGAQGTTSGGGLGVWLIGNKNTPNDATTAAAGITDSQFYISYNKSATADCRIQGHNATGFSIRPRLAVNADVDTVNTDYNLYVNGTVCIHRDTTTAADLPAGINFSVKDTTTNQTYSSGGIFAYHDHHASSTYGFNMVIKSGGAMIIGGGEAPSSLYTVLHNWAVENSNGNLNTESSYFVTDGTTYIYSNANTIANRIGIALSTGGNILPQKAEAANDNVQNLGASNNRWANIYSAYTHSSTFYFGVPSFANSNRAVLVYDSTHSNHGIWYFSGTNDAMTLDVHGKANSKTEADLAIGALGAGIISTRNRYIPHTNNTTGTVGTQYIPVYVNAGTITQITTNSVLTNLGSTTAASTYAASPRPGVTGTLPIANGGTGATTRLAAAKNLTNENVTSPGYVVSLTQNWANFGYTSIANLKTTLGINAGSMVQSQYLIREGTGTTSYSMTFNFAPDIIISLTSGSTDIAVDSYQGTLLTGAYNFNNNMVFMRFVPTGTYESALSSTAEDHTTGDFFSGLQFAPPMIKTGLFTNYFPYYVNGSSFTFSPNENSGGVLHQKSSNGKTYYLKAVSNTTGVAYAHNILNSSGVKYAFLALKFM